MSKIKQIAFVLMMIVLAAGVEAQSIDGEIIASKIKQKVMILNDYQKMLYDGERSADVKNYYRQQALDLLAGRGDAITVGGVEYEAPAIISTSISRKIPVRRLIKDYLQGVYDKRLSPKDLSMVKIPSFPKENKLSDFVKVKDDIYVYKAKITREFAGYIDGEPVYKDIEPYDYVLFVNLNKTSDGEDFDVLIYHLTIDEREIDKNKKK